MLSLVLANAWSWAPIDCGELESKNEGSASFWIPAYTKVMPRNARNTMSASGCSRQVATTSAGPETWLETEPGPERR